MRLAEKLDWKGLIIKRSVLGWVTVDFSFFINSYLANVENMVRPLAAEGGTLRG
jgi:hypothetical protein